MSSWSQLRAWIESSHVHCVARSVLEQGSGFGALKCTPAEIGTLKNYKDKWQAWVNNTHFIPGIVTIVGMYSGAYSSMELVATDLRKQPCVWKVWRTSQKGLPVTSGRCFEMWGGFAIVNYMCAHIESTLCWVHAKPACLTSSLWSCLYMGGWHESMSSCRGRLTTQQQFAWQNCLT